MAQPFIRYDTQDFVEVDDTPCECGREHLKIVRILGRDNDVLVMPSGRRFIVHNFYRLLPDGYSRTEKVYRPIPSSKAKEWLRSVPVSGERKL